MLGGAGGRGHASGGGDDGPGGEFVFGDEYDDEYDEFGEEEEDYDDDDDFGDEDLEMGGGWGRSGFGAGGGGGGDAAIADEAERIMAEMGMP